MDFTGSWNEAMTRGGDSAIWSPSPNAPSQTKRKQHLSMVASALPHKGARRAEEALSEVLRFRIPRGAVAYRFIGKKLRELILLKKLLPGMRLPTLGQLAELWGTNYFTVQTALTPLVEDGLLVRKQRVGTFVAAESAPVKGLAVYFGKSLLHSGDGGFYASLYAALSQVFGRSEVPVYLFMDERPARSRCSPLPALVQALERGEVDVVFGGLLGTEKEWLEKLPTRGTLLFDEEWNGLGEGGAWEESLEKGLERLRERGCRSVGIIAPGLSDPTGCFEKVASCGLETRREWVCSNYREGSDMRDFGYDSVSGLFSRGERPEGLIVYSDRAVSGAILGLLQMGLSIPEEVKVLFHCHDTLYSPCPIPADWMVSSLEAMAKGIAHRLGLHVGETPEVLTLQPISSAAPPLVRKSHSKTAGWFANASG